MYLKHLPALPKLSPLCYMPSVYDDPYHLIIECYKTNIWTLFDWLSHTYKVQNVYSAINIGNIKG